MPAPLKRLVGKLYEDFVYLSLRDLYANISRLNIFWNVKADGMEIVPDFTIGPTKDAPVVVILVSHSDSSKESNKKFWRNVNELREAKTLLRSSPRVYNVIFDSFLKQGIKEIESEIFDGQLVLGDTSYCSTIRAWIENNGLTVPEELEEKISYLSRSVSENKELKAAFKSLKEDIRGLLIKSNSALQRVWDLQAKRRHSSVHKHAATYLRRGWTKFLLIADYFDSKNNLHGSMGWAQDLGLVKRTIGGWRIVDPELSWFIRYGKFFNLNIPMRCCAPGFISQLAKVRSLALVPVFHEYLVSHLDELKTYDGMRRCVTALYVDPTSLITIPEHVEKPMGIWIWDYISSLIKAASDASQAFGYSDFSTHPYSAHSMVGSLTVGQWCASGGFFSKFLSRTDNGATPPDAIELSIRILADRLKGFSRTDIDALRDKIKARYIVKEYEDVLLSHRGFDPLLSILITNKVVDGEAPYRPVASCFGEFVGASAASSSTFVAHVGDAFIKWQTAFANPHDKRKELNGRAVGLRYTWDAKSKTFKPRPGVKRLVLFLDGTWTQKDLNALVAAGWDEIYYPDELDKLKASVLGKGKSGGVLPKLTREDGDEMLEAAEETKKYGKKR